MICKFPGWDLRLIGCNCLVHARCIPMEIVLNLKDASSDHSDGDSRSISSTATVLPLANNKGTRCPLCQGKINGIEFQPLLFDEIDRAVSLKREEKIASSGIMWHMHVTKENSGGGGGGISGRKHEREEEDKEIQAESPYLLLSSCNNSISCSARGERRTGRWTSEESAFVDYLVTAFDHGLLPLPHGIKLNDFLGEMLLCKSSRLTKKMKNAKLSTRSYAISKSCSQITDTDRERLSKLQDNFLSSIPSEFIRLVLKINLTKQWRSHFYNICLQVGYKLLQDDKWTASLDEIEVRAKKAEENIRRLRRRKMGFSRSGYDNFVVPKSNIQPPPSSSPSYMIQQTNERNINCSSINSSDTPSILRTTIGVDPSATNQFQNYTTAIANVTKINKSISHTTSTSLASNIAITIGHQSMHSMNSNNQKNNARTVSSSEDDGINNDHGNVVDSDRFYSIRNNPIVKFSHGRKRGISTDLSFSSTGGKQQTRPRSFSEDFDALLDVLNEEATSDSPKAILNEASSSAKHIFSRPLLDVIVTFMETINSSFQHTDIWVPSFESTTIEINSESSIPLMLYNAGFASRSGLNSNLVHKLREFGLYSSYFSFEPGKGLPGRVYASNSPVWEFDINDKDPKVFGRVEGAELYDVRTAIAVPFTTAAVGRIVVILYSNQYVPEDSTFTQNLLTELAKNDPASKWNICAIKKHQGDSNQELTKICSNEKNLESVTQVSTFKGLQITNYCQIPTSVTHANFNASRTASENRTREDYELADFLSANMPLSSNFASDPLSSSAIEAKTLRPYFLSFRLLLLRPSMERTSRENEIIGILKESFIAYLKDNRRNPKELANLIVKDWVCLKSTYSIRMINSTNKYSHETAFKIPRTSVMPSTQTPSTILDVYQHGNPSSSSSLVIAQRSASSTQSERIMDLSASRPLQQYVSTDCSHRSFSVSGDSYESALKFKQHSPRPNFLGSGSCEGTRGTKS